jgi:hypothetical protein
MRLMMVGVYGEGEVLIIQLQNCDITIQFAL